MQRTLIVLLGLLLSGQLFAEPRQWEPAGLPVRAVSLIEDYSQATRGDGTSLIVWSQSLGDFPVVRGQLLSPDGEAMWAEGGITLAQGERRAGAPVAVAVGGEWVIAWQDAELIASDFAQSGWYGQSALRLIRINDNGEPVWASGQAGFELVPSSEWWRARPYVLHPSGDGVIVTWRPTVDTWAQRITADGQTAWPEAVRLKAKLNTRLPDITVDQFGGLIFCWWQILSGDTMIIANRLQQDGTFAWNDTSGVVVHTADQLYYEVAICSDNLGGAYIAWLLDNDTYDPRGQYVSSQGVPAWPASGVVLADLAGERNIEALVPSFLNQTQDGTLLVMFEEGQAQISRILVQKLSGGGIPQWGASGATVCSALSAEYYIRRAVVASDQVGGALCYYDRKLNSAPYTTNVIATRVASDGSLPWGEECDVQVAAAQDYNVRITPPTVADEDVQVVWLELNYSETRTLRSQRLNIASGALEYLEPIIHATSDPRGVNDLQAVKLANGSTAIAWEERSAGVQTWKFQIVDVFGTPMFGPAGRPLAIEDEEVNLWRDICSLCSDAQGGFFAIFRRGAGGTEQLRAVHLNGQGEHISDPEGVRLFGELSDFFGVGILGMADGNGGCFVAAEVYNEVFFLIGAMIRIDSQCQPVWDDPVVYEDPLRDIQSKKLIPSVDGSCIWVYSPYEFQWVNVRAARIDSDGDEVWNVPLESDAYGTNPDVSACSDAANGAYVVWGTSSENGEEHYIRMQNISATGGKLWGDAGLSFTDTTYRPNSYSCDADQVGNLTVAWDKYNGQNLDIYAQRVTRAGNPLWPVGGLLLSNAARDQSEPTVVAISDNEVYVLWNDERNVTTDYWAYDIYGTHLNARGEIGDDSYWQENGSPVCDEDFDQRRFVAIADGAGGVMVAWHDQRTSFNWENSVFAQRLYDPIFTDADESPTIPTEFSLSQNYPNPFNPETVIEFALPTSSKATIKVFDVTGREVATLIDEPLTAGVHRVIFNAEKLASGVYFYTLKANSRSLTKKMVLLK